MVSLPAACFAWDISKSTNGTILVPDGQESTGTIEVTVNGSYKGGDTPVGSYDPTLFSSFNTSTVLYSLTYPGSVVISGLEVPLIPSFGRVQRVVVNNTGSGKTDYCAVVIYEPLQVAVSNNLTASVSGTTSVRSLDGTLAVDPWSMLSLGPEEVWLGSGAVLFTCGVVMAWAFSPSRYSRNA